MFWVIVLLHCGTVYKKSFHSHTVHPEWMWTLSFHFLYLFMWLETKMLKNTWAQFSSLTLDTHSYYLISNPMCSSTEVQNIQMKNVCYGPNLTCPVGLVQSIVTKEKNLLLSLSASLIFAASDPLSLLMLGGLQVNWSQITGLEGREPQGLIPNWNFTDLTDVWGSPVFPEGLSLSVSASSVLMFCLPQFSYSLSIPYL